MNLAILSNINMESINKHLPKGKFNEVYIAVYNQYIQELIDPNSYLHKKHFDYVFVHIDGEEFISSDYYSLNKQNSIEKINFLVDSIKHYLGESPNTSIIVSSFKIPPYNVFTHIQSGNSIFLLEQKINMQLQKYANKVHNVIYYNFNRLVELHGYNTIYDEKFWYLGRIKYSFDGFSYIAAELKSIIYATKGSSKKVLILDLDNTLWGGIIGEDGIDGIVLSEESIGKCYRDFQVAIKSVKQLGVILVVCSKNNHADAMAVFKTHSMMVLKSEDFTIKKINWKNKAQNIIELSNELNLGLESFVFIDDNPVERELIRKNLPQIAVPDFPKDVAELKKWFISSVIYQYFPKLVLTDEDKDKAQQYHRNMRRNQLSNTLDLDGFINSLDIRLKIHAKPKQYIPRLAQLSQKTNQFNLTTKRYTEIEIAEFVDSPQCYIYAIEYEDKFGKEGVIGEVIYFINDRNAHIELFLLSCRVIGRNVENAILQETVTDLKQNNIATLSAEYIPTPKNKLVENFYRECGLVERKKNKYHASVSDLYKKLFSNNKVNVIRLANQ